MTMKSPDELSYEEIQAWVISLSIRNALEMFHGGGAMDPENPDAEEGFITDRQMKAMNIVIRKTVADAVEMLENPEENGAHIVMALFGRNDYMEPPFSPELDAAFTDIEAGRFDPPWFVPDCTRDKP
jgi:hypothetical protein